MGYVTYAHKTDDITDRKTNEINNNKKALVSEHKAQVNIVEDDERTKNEEKKEYRLSRVHDLPEQCSRCAHATHSTRYYYYFFFSRISLLTEYSFQSHLFDLFCVCASVCIYLI